MATLHQDSGSFVWVVPSHTNRLSNIPGYQFNLWKLSGRPLLVFKTLFSCLFKLWILNNNIKIIKKVVLTHLKYS